MRSGLLTLLLVALAVLAAVGMAQDTEPQEVVVDVDSDLLVEEETLEAQPDEADAVPVQEIDPRLTPEAIEKVFSKLSAKCLKQVQENPTDPTQVSDRCRTEVARRIQRYLERLDKAEKGESEEDKTADKGPNKHKRRSRKSKKQSRAQREAAKAQKKEEEYQQTLQTIIGFVVTFVAVIAGAIFFINRKLKAAGMYFPDPDAKATCCN